MLDIGTRYDSTKEAEIYRLWEESGYFNPDKLPKTHKKPFCIIMPPPNANGSLHIGHALFVTLQDIMIRYYRMRGRKTLWLPGADHAGFETQVVFDKKLEKEGRSRFSIPREELYAEMLRFTLDNKKTMEDQLKKLGASCDWSREKFTLDEDIVRETQQAFIDMYKEGLIYRGKRLVNWCVKHQTTLSDLEVKYAERKDPLYYIKYGPLTLATVRPETKFGDTALAVHPKDKRYQKYIGKEIEAEGLLGKLKFRVIADEAVDPNFGTGVVKVTPAHDLADFEMGSRHNLEAKDVIDRFGRLNEKTGPYQGLKVAEARIRVAEDLKKKGLLKKTDENYVHNVAVCYKCEQTLEPRLMPQWFVKMKPLAEQAAEAARRGKIKFIPDRFKKIYFHWLKNIRDWNISRQVPWGIRIPAWYKNQKSEIRNRKSEIWNLKIYGREIFDAIAQGTKKIETRAGRPMGKGKYWGNFNPGDAVEFSLADEKTDMVIASVPPTKKYVNKVTHFRTVDEMFRTYKPEDDYPGKTAAQIKKWWKQRPALDQRIKDYGIWAIELRDTEEEIYVGTRAPGGGDWIQDPDVFDTWFSSSQWPFLALGFRAESSPKSKFRNDFKTFYPTDVMETAYDILFFWVARMIMMGLYCTGKIPFKTVYIHGLVRDAFRQKMSKSKGNVIDPLNVAETYGTDAVRMSLVVGNTPGTDLAMSEDKIRGYRNFSTKLWNIARFILMAGYRESAGLAMSKRLTPAERKIIRDLENIKKKVAKYIETFQFHLAAETVYHYTWHTFADKIIEANKEKPNYPLLRHILAEILKMLHPFMPFITEAIYQKLPSTKAGELLMMEKWQ